MTYSTSYSTRKSNGVFNLVMNGAYLAIVATLAYAVISLVK